MDWSFIAVLFLIIIPLVALLTSSTTFEPEKAPPPPEEEKDPDKDAPEVKAHGKIVVKYQNAKSEAGKKDYCMALFELDNGDRLEYYMTPEVFDSIKEGQSGVLTTKGGGFLGIDLDVKFRICSYCGATVSGKECRYCETPWKK